MPQEGTPNSPNKPSPVPSWVMLGFVLGAAVVLAIPRNSETPAPAAAPEPVAPTAAPREMSTIEAVFDSWGKYAVWSENSTQVALWNAQTKDFSDCYEVLKVEDALYFRSIPALTRPVLAHGVADGSPLRFTETERQRAEWLRESNQENWKAIAKGVQQSLGPVSAPKDK